MAATYNFKILTPNATALDDEVVSVVAPGEAGYLGVLANHAPLITTLQSGQLTVRFHDNREVRYRIGAGILKVAHNQAVLLTESIESQEG
ncbi:MAG: F0F1 ATP synthase subunit epsilon [Candidatus Krumholzibacteria bacterium]|nr:F0F1 ATP synthase subunit epsilon [Candidatus Krumholzibacteria bacterium]